MGPSEEYVEFGRGQVCGGRRRACLLKGCERPFDPPHPLARYCGPDCREAARRWARGGANRRYRASDQGKEQRREQARRYRARVRRRREEEAAEEAEKAGKADGEGYPQRLERDFFRCQRPGCYECFAGSARSPDRKFCNSSCRHALRRVLRRERAWLRRLAGSAAIRAGPADER